MVRKGIASNFTLGKQERLKSRKLIAEVFSGGKAVNAQPVKALYKFTEAVTPLQAGFTVSSKNFKKAVDRNRIKRLMREAYRLQKGQLQEKLITAKKSIVVFFIYTGRELPDFGIVSAKLSSILDQIVRDVETQ